MTIDAAGIAIVLRRGGIDVREAGIAEAFERAFAGVLTPPAGAALTAHDLAALTEGGFEFAAGESDYARAVERSTGQYAALLATAVPLAAAAGLLHVTRARAQQLVSAGDLWAVRVDGRWLLPAVQFTGGDRTPGLPAVLQGMRANDRHPLTVLAFLTAPQPEFELDSGIPLSALEWLRRGGNPADAIALAESLDRLG